MKYLRRLGTLLHQNPRRLCIFFEATIGLLRAYWLVRRSDFGQYKNNLGSPSSGEVLTEPVSDYTVLKDIRWSIMSLDRTMPGRFTCLMQVIATQRMLVRRRIPYAIVFGAKLGATSDPRTDGDDMAAHAWLRAGGGIVVGERERAMFAPVISYVGYYCVENH